LGGFEIAFEDQGILDSETEGCEQIREMQASLGENRELNLSHLLLLVVMKRRIGSAENFLSFGSFIGFRCSQ
jgi:hypothetical protein